ncbi:ATP-grasp domain-containing protein [Paenibacillus andongensis]|uniref:ATP-grasp domain-containing protein n=1 Tax=Paenibacillus andongensis TaxID=2975482 RepID=UPI0021BA8B80|nr:ATP-grasp domain-containing protein [Paenibacillus andongensis]
MQIPLIRKAKSKGIYTIAADMNNDAPGKFEADEFHPISTNNTNELLKLACQEDVSGVITNSDYPMRTTSSISQELGLIGLSPVTALIATNKLLLREILSESGILSPKFAKITKEADINYQVENIGLPFILKPVDSSASRGVFRIDHNEEIKLAYEQSLLSSKNQILIMEQYITGNEYSVESITIKGKTKMIAITEKSTTGAPHYVELGHIIPANLSHDRYEQIENLIKSALYAIGFSNGVAHTELKINDEGIFIIEIGPRLGGDYITSDLVPLATGYDMLGNNINLILDEPIIEEISINRFAGIVFFTAPSGKLMEIRGLEFLRTNKKIVRYEFFVGIGDIVSQLRSSLDRVGYAIVVDDSYDAFCSMLNELKKNVSFDIN